MRREPKAVLALQAWIAALGKISAERDPTSWYTTPRLIDAATAAGADVGPLPAIFATIDLGPDEPLMTGATPARHRMSFALHGLLFVPQADKGFEMLKLIADVLRATMTDEQLGSLMEGMLVLQSGGYDLDATSKVTGAAVGRVVFGGPLCHYEWTHDVT